ncbi:MAG: serine/threonine-protein phosphatase, partial [Oscillospiraceae bacterium]
YSTFSILRVTNGNQMQIIQYDNPDVIVLRDGKNFEYPRTETIIAGKRILESRFEVRIGDVFVAMSDGAIHAGVGMTLNFGWERPNIVAYAEEHYRPELSAKSVAALISDACRDLYMNKPGDDTTIAALKIRLRQPVSLMIGPPVKPEDDARVMDEFFGIDGKKIVCGGTTSSLVSRYLAKPVQASIDYLDPEIPPTAKIEGIDLVTEGVITMSRVVEIAQRYTSTTDPYNEWMGKRDGASQIARLLFEEATDINLYVGRAINPAHQNPNMPISLSIKLGLVKDLAALLRKMGKHVTLTYN